MPDVRPPMIILAKQTLKRIVHTTQGNAPHGSAAGGIVWWIRVEGGMLNPFREMWYGAASWENPRGIRGSKTGTI